MAIGARLGLGHPRVRHDGFDRAMKPMTTAATNAAPFCPIEERT
jgi:hypothetical protein